MTTGLSPAAAVDRTVVPIVFPDNDEFDAATSSCSFVSACHLAAETHRPIHLGCDIDSESLDTIITLRKHQHLIIRGRRQQEETKEEFPNSSSDTSTINHHNNNNSQKKKRTKNPLISGKLHSLFLLNNSSRLTLDHIDLRHEASHEDCRQIGAAVNLRYKSTALLQHCTIESESGFCGWAVQKSKLTVSDCILRAPIRSALVCFGQASLQVRQCHIEKPGVHGVCARGECHIHIQDSVIENATVRGVYAYANACLILERTILSGTIRSDMAALEVRSGDDDDNATSKSNGNNHYHSTKRSSLTMTNCRVVQNAGAGVKIRGDVLLHNKDLEDGENCFEQNHGGNVVVVVHPTDDSDEIGDQISDHRSWNRPPQRDEAASSFRQGDWWCPQCFQPRRVIPSTMHACSQCHAKKETGKLLTPSEVVDLNRGVWVDPTTTISNTPTWWFHGDKKDNDWIQYDETSSRTLEEAFQQQVLLKSSINSGEVLSTKYTENGAGENKEAVTNSPQVTVSILGGKYQVNVKTMEQINTETMYPRLIRRKC
ncbi:WWE domain containing protein [Nitzschia inconspicua]|uniref:WWE domain containing protein n=1 Tax=Nitzschia inconspicua TaxID=303405 RepID=A0A9K3LJQ5_9STRA|nr:WWE domain containing protein [Nitzschia inconspicua]